MVYVVRGIVFTDKYRCGNPPLPFFATTRAELVLLSHEMKTHTCDTIINSTVCDIYSSLIIQSR